MSCDDAKAVQFRQHAIEHDDVEAVGACALIIFATVARDGRLMSACTKTRGDEPCAVPSSSSLIPPEFSCRRLSRMNAEPSNALARGRRWRDEQPRTTLQRRPSETWSPAYAAADGDITKTSCTGRPDLDATRRPFALRPGTKASPSLDPVTNPEQTAFGGIRLSGRAAHTATARRGLSADERYGEARRGRPRPRVMGPVR